MNPAHIFRNRAVRRWFTSQLWLPVLIALSTAAGVQAQDVAPPTEELPAGQIRMRQDDGTFVPLEELGFSSQQVAQFLDWLTTQQGVSNFEVTRIDASGTVHNGRAEMHVDLEIEIHTDSDWVRVDVGFGSWIITHFEHRPRDSLFDSRFPGNATNASNNRDWFLKGKGSHVLALDLIAEVRDQEADRHRLKMSLPAAVVSKLQLTFDEMIEGVEANVGDTEPITSVNGQSTVTFWALKPETEISWQSQAPLGDKATVISTPDPAKMILDLTSSTPALTCDLTVKIAEGAVDQLTVRLPPGYSEAYITGRDENDDSIVQSAPVSIIDGVSTANIVFTKSVRRRVELHFDLGLGLKDTTRAISVSVPDIDGVPEQSAKVEIRIPRGSDVEILPGLHRRRARVETQSNQRNEAIAFDLLSTEATLQLHVRKVEARFAVEPQLEFSTDDQRLLLLAQFPVNVSRGSLDELQINWRGHIEDGWQIDPGSFYLTEDGGEREKLSHVPNNGDIGLPLGSGQSGQFSVEFQAFRSLDSNSRETGAQFSLPDVVASTVHPTIVSLIESDTYSLSLINANDNSRFSMVPSRQLPSPEHPQRATTWRINDSDSTVRVMQTRQTPEIRSRAVVALEARNDAIYVHTEIEIDVRHRDLGELTFTAPHGVEPDLKLSDHETPLRLGERDGEEIVWRLPEAIRGKHKASIDYFWVPQKDNRLPLVLPSRGLESVMIGTDAPDVLSVVEDKTLRLQFSRDFRAAWATDEMRNHVELRIPQSLYHRQSLDPSICLVQTQIDPSFTSSTTTVIYEQSPRMVLFQVPADAGVYSSMVNGIPVERAPIELSEMDSGQLWQIAVPPGLPEGAVRVSLTSRTPRETHHHLLSTAKATCPRVVDAPDWLTIAWLVSTRDEDRLVSMRARQPSVLDRTVTDALLFSSTSRTSGSVESALTGFPESVRKAFDDSFNAKNASLAFIAGPELQTIPVMIYSRAMGWVMAAGLGVLFYSAMVSLRRHLRLMSAMLIPAGVLTWVALPQQTLALVSPVLPALIVATIAWMIRQLLMPLGIQRRSRHRRKSVFASAPRAPSHAAASDPLPHPGAEPAVQ